MTAILCLPSTAVNAHCSTLWTPDVATLKQIPAVYRDRDSVEHDPAFRQIITYTILMRGGEVLAYPRTTGDARLLNTWSIGFGGHVERRKDHQERGGILAVIQAAQVRELEEEILSPETVVTGRAVLGLICERPHIVAGEPAPVGACHLGVVEVWQIADREAIRVGAEIQAVAWLPLQELFDLESWSAECVVLLSALRDRTT